MENIFTYNEDERKVTFKVPNDNIVYNNFNEEELEHFSSALELKLSKIVGVGVFTNINCVKNNIIVTLDKEVQARGLSLFVVNISTIMNSIKETMSVCMILPSELTSFCSIALKKMKI